LRCSANPKRRAESSAGTLVKLLPASYIFPGIVSRRIPLYSADGELTGWVSPQRLARLQADGLISRVIKHPKGYVNRAYLYRSSGEGSPVELGQYLGTRYHFREHLPAGYLCWSLRKVSDALRPFFFSTVLERCTYAVHHAGRA